MTSFSSNPFPNFLGFLTPRLLIVDGDETTHQALASAPMISSFEFLRAYTGHQALQLVSTAIPDLILLDLDLPDVDGKKVISEVRFFAATPIIVLTARDNHMEKIAALDLGAHDYVQKPFAIGELMARIRVALRHRRMSPKIPKKFEIRGLVVDLALSRIHGDGVRTHLSPQECLLLSILLANAGRVVSNRQIFAAIWGLASTDLKQTLRVLVSQLRAKLESDPANPQIIVTEPRVGYRLRIEN